MAQYDSPGIFIEEKSAGERTISTVSPSALGIMGYSLRGDHQNAIPFNSFDEFERYCGSYIMSSETAYQVKAFFDNGGGRGWLARAIYAATAAKAFFQVSSTLATNASITGDKDQAGGVVVIAGSLTNVKITVDTIYVADDLDVTAGGGNGNYDIQTVCDNINTVLVGLFGSAFGSVATVANGSAPGTKALKLTSPSTGTGSKIAVAASATNSGLASIYGTTANATGVAASGNTFKVKCQYVGEDGNKISFFILRNPNDITGHIYDMTVLYNGESVEYYEAISFHYDDRNAANYYKTMIENSSAWIGITENGSISGLLVPTAGVGTASVPQAIASGHESISNGDTVADADKQTALTNALGLFNGVHEILNLICPDAENLPAVNCKIVFQAIANYYANTERNKDTFAILGTPTSLDDATNLTNVTSFVKTDLAITHSYAAIYFPAVKIFDILRRKNRRTSVAGFVAGIYARTDNTKNVGKAPGGITDGALLNISSVYRVLTKGDRDTLYQSRINPIISTPETGRAVWGVRTLSLDSEWRYINARRLFIFCERSVYGSMQFSVFENNGPRLWLLLRTTIGSFLQGLFVDGYFAGATEADAYYVICDESNNPTSQINAGLVTVDVGIAINKPAEFVKIRFSQKVKTV